jgi:hypothetical protein
MIVQLQAVHPGVHLRMRFVLALGMQLAAHLGVHP